jgi:hypothetical protein
MKKILFILILLVFVLDTVLVAQDGTDLLWDYTLKNYPEAALHKRNLDFKLLTNPGSVNY